jgi:xanthine dehydrogenase accessory factor
MYDVLAEINRWLSSNDTVALATVINTWGSAPRGVGAKMAFTPDGKLSGSVSGGCVEGAVFDAGVRVLKTGSPELLHFGVSDETAFSVGLACGGNIEVFVKPLDADFFRLVQAEIEAGDPLAIVSIIQGPTSYTGRELLITESGHVQGGLGPELDLLGQEAARAGLESGQPGIVEAKLASGEDVRIFVDVITPPPLLVMVGGVHIAIALASLAKTLGFRTVVIDPRRAFGSQERFPHVDHLIQDWPQEAFDEVTLTRSTAVAMLTHDPKIDDPALKIVLDSPAFYIGALGSRKTHEKRRQRLLDEGVAAEKLARLHAPIGLELGGRTPEEIALAIMAEIVAVKHGRRDPLS